MTSSQARLAVLFVVCWPFFAAEVPFLRLKSARPESRTERFKRLNPLRQHRVVEYSEWPSAERLRELRHRGVKVLRRIPDNGVLISLQDGEDLAGRGLLRATRFGRDRKLSRALWNRNARREGSTHVLVEFHPDVEEGDARTIVSREGMRIREHPDLLRIHLLVEGNREQVEQLAEWDEVAYVFPASEDLVQGLPVASCHAILEGEDGIGQYVATVGDGWDGPGTGSAALTYTYGVFTPDLPEASVRSEMDRAYAEWSSYVEVDFSPGASSTASRNIHVLFGAGSHGDSYPFDGPSGTLAHAFYPSPPNPEPIAGDLHFDDDETWRVGNHMDLFSVGLHELGHSLGLGHADDPNAVMYPYYSIASGLHSVDIEAIQTLYAGRGGGASAPEAVSVSPSSGSGLSQTFRFTYSDANGHEELGWVFGLVHTQLSPAEGCFFQYLPSQDALWLRNDSGLAWLGPVTPGSGSPLANSQCSVNVAASEVTTSGSDLLLDLALTFESSFSGPKKLYLYAADTTGSNSGWQQRGTWDPVPDQPPQAVSVSPSSGSGAAQAFQFTYSDPNGYAQMGWVFGLFHNQLSPSDSCFFQYNPLSNALWLRTDAGNGWTGPWPLGGPMTPLSNSQCSINVTASSASSSGTDLVLDMVLNFQGGFTGTKNIYLYAADVTGRSSGWQQRGTWNPQVSAAPAAVSVAPASGSGADQTFQFTFSDANGYSQMGWVFTLFHSQLSPANGCYVQYNHSSGSLWLQSDSGANWLGPVTMGAAATLANSQCTLDAQTSSAAGNGSNLTLDLALSFEPGFSGSKNVYMYAADITGLSSGWVPCGSWNPMDASPPQAVSVSPSGGSGTSQTFQFTFSDGNGYREMGWVFALLHSQLSASNGCYVQYNHGSNRLWLMNDSGSGWLGPVSLGSVATLQNGQCSLSALASSASGTGNTLTLEVAITFRPGFTGQKSIYMYAADTSGLSSGWQTRGSWTP